MYGTLSKSHVMHESSALFERFLLCGTAGYRRQAGLRGLLYAAIDTVMAWMDRAGQRRALGALDDHLLKDVGLSRADVERETSKPFWRA